MQRKRTSGFSLVELLITLAVIGVLLGAGQPLMAMMLESRRVSGAAEAVQSALHFARSEGIKQMVPMVVTYSMNNTGAWRVGIRDRTTCDTTVADPEDEIACSIPQADERVLKVFEAAEFPGVIARATRGSTRFNPVRGTALGTNATVTLRSAGGKEVRVIVSNIGRVRSCSPSGDGKVLGYPAC